MLCLTRAPLWAMMMKVKMSYHYGCPQEVVSSEEKLLRNIYATNGDSTGVGFQNIQPPVKFENEHHDDLAEVEINDQLVVFEPQGGQQSDTHEDLAQQDEDGEQHTRFPIA